MLDDPLILTVVSGKGGVGKTMLSVAVANELSKARPTLLVDLDFFNRGITGLMATLKNRKTGRRLEMPDFLRTTEADPEAPEDPGDGADWVAVEIRKNLWFVDYPDLTQAEIRKFETMAVGELKAALADFLNKALKVTGCDCVVLDCHGGPDNSSFAACLISDHNLMVSEPDRITLFGTLNFLRQLWSASGDLRVDMHMVFNKIVPAFSPVFLRRFYDKYLKEEFGGRPLLAMYPMEVYLTKEFERTPFLTDVYPTSLLARKTQVLLYDLLAGRDEIYLTPRVRSLWGPIRVYDRSSLGKPTLLFDTDFVMQVMVVGMIIAGGIYFVDTQLHDVAAFTQVQAFTQKLMDMLNEYGYQLLAVAAEWFALALFSTWHWRIDRKFTYCARRRHFGNAISTWLAAGVLWTFPLALYGAEFASIETRMASADPTAPGKLMGLGPDEIFEVVFMVGASLILVAVCCKNLFRIYDDLRFEHRYFEPVFRILSLAFIGFMILVGTSQQL
jgi:cellulose biosynthesis protein BcsQ